MITPLLTTSCYSFHYGTSTPKDLVRRAKELGYTALALTDRGVYGIPAFLEACSEEGILPILGTEIPTQGGRILLLARTRTGWSRMSRLLSDQAEGAFDPRLAALALLEEAPGVPRQHAAPDLYLASDDLSILKHAGKKAYALLSPANRKAWSRLLATGAPPVASGEARFIAPGDWTLQRILIAIGSLRTVADVAEAELSSSRAMLIGPGEAAREYADAPESLKANEALCQSIALRSIFDGFVFPRYPAGQEGAAARLRTDVEGGASRRYGSINGRVRRRIDYELDIIEEKGFSDYFLTVRDIVRKTSRTCGRGSAAASIVSYCLGVTDVDPIAHNLYFDRFLNPGRKDPPDIDVDFAWDERDEILASVVEDFGPERAARVSNHVAFQARSALRETARAYGMSEGEIREMERALSLDREDALSRADEAWREILNMAPRIVGFPRHLGVHSGGMIIVPDRLADYVPVGKSGSGIRVTVWDKEGVEAAGLVKIDLLGNRSLAVVRDALANLEENGTPIAEDTWRPIEDEATVDLLARGDTMGVFYVESPAMRLLQKKTGRGDFEHLVIHSSIIRPAANAYINEYIDRLNGKPYKPLHPLLGDLLAETYGIMCYQEDVSKVAVALAGMTAAEADGIRKILSKKNVKVRLESYRERFFEGARSNGVDDGTISKIWEMIASFAGYSFVKAHSASYAMLSFRSAYLRAHHPAEFMAAVISNRGGFYSTLAYASECRRMGLRLLPPDINESAARCRGREGTVRFGLAMIGSLGEKTVDKIVRERNQGGPYASALDFCNRVPVDRTEAEALVGSGALDSLCGSEGRASCLMELLSRATVREAGDGPELNLFASGQVRPSRRSPGPPGRRRVLESQLQYLGATLDESPLCLWPEVLSLSRSLGRDLPRLAGRRVTLAGIPITVKPVLTVSKQPMEFVSFEDETALYETVLFPEAYKRYRHLLYEQSPVLIYGKVESDHGAVTVTVEKVEKAKAKLPVFNKPRDTG